MELDFTTPAGVTIYKHVSAILDAYFRQWPQGCFQGVRTVGGKNVLDDVTYNEKLA